MAAKIESQAHTAQAGDFPRPCEILFLASPPAMHEEDAWDRSLRLDRGEQRASDMLAIDCNVEDFIDQDHTLRPEC